LNTFLLEEQQKRKDQNDSESIITGCDAILCHLNKATGLLRYAGAKRPLMHISNGKMSRLKGSRSSIGLYQLENKVFELNEIEAKSGDTLFLYSDGFADQIGGPQNKKMKREYLHDILATDKGLSGEEKTEQLQNAFLDWKGNNEQLDDVTVLGVKI